MITVRQLDFASDLLQRAPVLGLIRSLAKWGLLAAIGASVVAQLPDVSPQGAHQQQGAEP